MKVVFSPYVESDLWELIEILINEGYISSFPFAVKFVQDLVEYIETHLQNKPHKKAPNIFGKYGHNLKYITYNSKSKTTWYILFEEHVDSYFVTYITNNKFEGHYFNV